MEGELRSALARFVLEKQREAVVRLEGKVLRLEGTAVDGMPVVLAHEIASERGPTMAEELRLLRARASLGLVAASFVHDFNNLLTPILLLSARLVRELAEDGEAAMMASEIHAGAALAASLARDVLALARPRTPSVERVDVNDVVLELQRLVRRLAGDEVDVSFELVDAPCEAMLDRKRLEHALLNLVVNARDAMRDGGRLVIRTALVEDGEMRIALSVSDDGVGMSDGLRRDLLAGLGAGLGLPSVQRFARDSGGSFDIASTPGEGTRVTIQLDALPPAPPQPSPRTRAVDAKGAGESVLVAERDDRVRRSIRLALEAHGYTPVTVASQDDALAAAAMHPVHVALLDMNLVRRAPTTFLHQLRALSPDVRFVLLSDAQPAEHASPPLVSVLAKPFGVEELVGAVRDALARR